MMTVLAGVQFFLVLAFVRDYSLRRDDDAAQKEAAKNWLETRKRKESSTAAPQAVEDVEKAQ